jgi:hypothetical protein
MEVAMLHRFVVVVLMWWIGAGTILAAGPRDVLVDQLASDQIDRIDFVATTFEGALARVERVADQILQQGTEVSDSPERTGEVCSRVIQGINGFRPRTDGYVFGKLTLMILDAEDADRLAELVVASAKIIEADPVARNTIVSATEQLMRGVVLDIEEGTPPLEQLLEHVRVVATLPPQEQAKFLR